jgi:hypothetical protein
MELLRPVRDLVSCVVNVFNKNAVINVFNNNAVILSERSESKDLQLLLFCPPATLLGRINKPCFPSWVPQVPLLEPGKPQNSMVRNHPVRDLVSCIVNGFNENAVINGFNKNAVILSERSESKDLQLLLFCSQQLSWAGSISRVFRVGCPRSRFWDLGNHELKIRNHAVIYLPRQ